MPHWLISLLLGATPLLCCIALRALLDLRIAYWAITVLDWIPVRGWFRDHPVCLRGDWEQTWSSQSEGFAEETDRHSNVKVYQFARYCYAEFTAKGVRYSVFGRIHNDFLFGEWYAKMDRLGYFGAFKLRLMDAKTMSGKWLGHSKSTTAINVGEWDWKKTE